MNKVLALTFVILNLYSFVAKALSLDAALQKAKAYNPELKLSEFDYRVSASSYDEEKSEFYPIFGVEGGYQKFDARTEYLSGTYSHIFGEYKFDLAGSQYFKYRAAAIAAELALLKNEQMKEYLVWSIESKFSRGLYLQESIKLYLTALEQNQTYANMARKKQASGLASDADMIEFDLNEAILKSDLEEIKSEFSEALSQLKISLGADFGSEPVLQGKLEHFHITENIEQIKLRLSKQSYRLQAAKLELQQASYLRSSSYGGFMPEVSLKATYGRRGIDEPEGPEHAYFAVARWELFSGFKNSADYDKATALKERAEFEVRQSGLSLPIQLETEYKKFLSLQNRVDLESQNRERAKKYLKAVMNEYGRGVKNSADLRSASMQLLDSSLRDLKFRYEGIKQKEELQRLLGQSIAFEAYSTDHSIN